MSISSKILSDQYAPLNGFRANPTDDTVDTDRVISGEGSDTRKDRGHRDLGQVIRKGLEQITRSTTARFQTSGQIDPGKTTSYVIRAGATLDIELAKPPAVPTEQLTPAGKARERHWHVDVLIYYSQNCTLTWPSNCIFGRAGYDLEGNLESGYMLTSRAVAPNPRPISHSD